MLKKSEPGYYQLVLMDVRMPEMNGYEATKVQLSNGEKAKVVKNNPGYILRPKVVGIESGKIYDLYKGNS